MPKNSINTRFVSILFASSLTVSMAIPGLSVTPPPENIPPVRAKPPTTETPIPKVIPVRTPTPTKSPPATISTPTSPNNPPLVAIPTLTPTTLKNFINLYGQVLEVKFTPNQTQKIQQRLKKDWTINLGLRNIVAQTMAMEPQISRGNPAELTQLQTKLVGNLRQQVLDGDTNALWLISFYDANAKNWLAPGSPPLTRMTTDISADALCFMVNEIMGKSVVSLDRQLKDAIATKLTAEYANIPANIKQELFRLPPNWLKFKDDEWFRRGDDFREQMRVQWGQNLETYIPELREIIKLRRDRLAKLKADPKIAWDRINSRQRQVALQQSELDFQNSLRSIAQVKTIQLNNYIGTMQVANSIGNSPTRYSSKLKNN